MSPTDILSSTDHINDLLDFGSPTSPRSPSRRRRNDSFGQRSVISFDDNVATNTMPVVPESNAAHELENPLHKGPVVAAKASAGENATVTTSDALQSTDDAALKAKEDARIEELKATIKDLQRQEQEIIKGIRGEGTPSSIIDKHIRELHRYNEIKDAGQIILGKLAELEGTTIKKQYEIFGLDQDD
ncbi:Swi5-domain-containing protein [Mortierella sp. GBAus27b]|nr:swi5-like zinc finger protein [Mortierella sp. GBA43]KAI8350845.1 Swi5-domain-containing protein [Mortierella sp. GBAus27b]